MSSAVFAAQNARAADARAAHPHECGATQRGFERWTAGPSHFRDVLAKAHQRVRFVLL